jgi:hypothetical protein
MQWDCRRFVPPANHMQKPVKNVDIFAPNLRYLMHTQTGECGKQNHHAGSSAVYFSQ